MTITLDSRPSAERTIGDIIAQGFAAAIDTYQPTIDALRGSAPVNSPELEPNDVLLYDTLTYITNHPELHVQDQWARKMNGVAVGCAAFHAARLTGHEMEWHDVYGRPGWQRSSCTTRGALYEVAKRELGFTREQADKFFHGTRTIDDLWELATEFTNGRVTRPEPAVVS